MKAVSLLPEWAMMVALGEKTVECRTWKTDHRGDLLVCASSRKTDGFVSGHALCVVSLDAIVPFAVEHLRPAIMDFSDMPDGCLAWCLSNARMVEPFPVRGRLHLYDVPDDGIRVLGEPTRELFETYFKPLIHRGRNLGIPEFWSMVYKDFGWC